MVIEQLKKKRLCHRCVGDSYFSSEIARRGRIMRCSYCDQVEKSYYIGKIAERFDQVFEQHYVRTSDHPNEFQYFMLADKESDYEWKREGEPILYAIMNAADISEKVAHDIQQILENKYSDYYDEMGEETEYASDSYYEEKGADDYYWQNEWQDFERLLKTETRFFSSKAMNYLMSVFDKIDLMRTREDHSIVVDAGPGTQFEAFYRARVFQSAKQLKDALIRPDLHLGPPPSVCAKAGRMNAHGIAVFYGSNNPDVAIAEVRPPVGSWVGVARFQLVRGLRLLDLTAMRKMVTYGSINTILGNFQINFVNKPGCFDSKNLRVKFGVSHRRPP